ncbi:hypothetical protein ACW2QC_03860 [Virgibacillus sp. FSP13]
MDLFLIECAEAASLKASFLEKVMVKRGAMMGNKKYTAAGTDIETVKQQNDDSGMSYNEAKEFIAKTTGGHGTGVYSDTDREEVRKKNQS